MASEHKRRIHFSRPLAFLDLETTGRWPERDRIVEVGVVKVEHGSPLQEFHSHINPECRIPREATAIHGISNEDVRRAPTFRRIASRLLKLLSGCDLAGFNLARFDLPLLRAEFQRTSLTFDPTSCRIVDVQVIFHRKEPRDLTAAYKFYCGKSHTGAHSALADARACREILRAQVRAYQDLPVSVRELAELCTSARSAGLDSGGWFETRDGEPAFARGKHAGRPLAEIGREAPDYLDWMLRDVDLPPDTREIILDAQRGKQ